MSGCGSASKAAARAARRDPATVRLLAVTKVFGPEAIREGYALGLRDFGENYVQEMERKAPAVADLAGARFHLIGHLQSNKTKKAAQLFSIHRFDRFRETCARGSELMPNRSRST